MKGQTHIWPYNNTPFVFISYSLNMLSVDDTHSICGIYVQLCDQALKHCITKSSKWNKDFMLVILFALVLQQMKHSTRNVKKYPISFMNTTVSNGFKNLNMGPQTGCTSEKSKTCQFTGPYICTQKRNLKLVGDHNAKRMTGPALKFQMYLLATVCSHLPYRHIKTISVSHRASKSVNSNCIQSWKNVIRLKTCLRVGYCVRHSENPPQQLLLTLLSLLVP